MFFIHIGFCMYEVGASRTKNIWIGWHVWQLRFENRTDQDELLRLNSPDKIERAMREPHLG